MLRVLYFAWIRARVGIAEEELAPPPDVDRVDRLVAWLAARGPNYAAAFADPGAVRVAVNQDHVAHDHPLKAGDEVALFPPVTGG